MRSSERQTNMVDFRNESRRRFLSFFSGIGLGGTLLPGVLWAQLQQAGSTASAQPITHPMLKDALALSGLTFDDADTQAMLQAANQNLTRYEDVRKIPIPNDVSPPFYFSAITPGMKVNRARAALRFSAPRVKRPANLEDVAFWPVTQLAQLIRTRQVTSVELTQMYLARLHRYNDKLNCVVTFLDDLALAQAKQADAEIAAGKYKGPLHGIPWGAKDIIAVKGYKTTWGSGAYKDQMIDEEASVVEMLRDAGAVLHRQAHLGRTGAGRSLVRRPDEEPVESRRRIQRVVGRSGFRDRRGLRGIRHRQRNQRVDPEPVRRAAASPGCVPPSAASAATA